MNLDKITIIDLDKLTLCGWVEITEFYNKAAEQEINFVSLEDIIKAVITAINFNEYEHNLTKVENKWPEVKLNVQGKVVKYPDGLVSRHSNICIVGWLTRLLRKLGVMNEIEAMLSYNDMQRFCQLNSLLGYELFSDKEAVLEIYNYFVQYKHMPNETYKKLAGKNKKYYV